MSSKLRIREGTEQGENTTGKPEENDGIAVVHAVQLKTQTGKNPGSNHVGHNNGGSGINGNFSFQQLKVLTCYPIHPIPAAPIGNFTEYTRQISP